MGVGTDIVKGVAGGLGGVGSAVGRTLVPGFGGGGPKLGGGGKMPGLIGGEVCPTCKGTGRAPRPGDAQLLKPLGGVEGIV